MGLFRWLKGKGKTINRVIVLGLIVFDSYLAFLIYEPASLVKTIEAWTKPKNSEAVLAPSPDTKQVESAEGQVDPSPKPSSTWLTPSPSPTQTNETNNTLGESAGEQASPVSTTSPTASSTPSSTPSPSPIPSPSLAASPTPTPSPSPVNTPTTSSVYIQAYVYANNQQLVAEQYPVKVVNNQTGETISTGETDHSGKSPTWQINANTNISVYLYPKPGTNGCGDVWTVTIGSLGTLETHNLSIQGERNPCITL